MSLSISRQNFYPVKMAGFFVAPSVGGARSPKKSLSWGRCFPARTAMVNTSEGRPPLHQTQMKLFNAIAAAAVIGASLIAANLSEAQSQWKIVYPEGQKYITYVKGMTRRGNVVSYHDKIYKKSTGKTTTLYSQANCSDWTTRSRFPSDGSWSSWEEQLPETLGSNTVAFVCKY